LFLAEPKTARIAAVKRPHKPDDAQNGADEFQREVTGIRRLEHNQAPRPESRVLVSKRRLEPVTDESSDALGFRRDGVQVSMFKRLRRGQYPIEATLDLHAATAAEAEIRIRSFIQESQAKGFRAVRIIHGKGNRSEGQRPVLKPKVGPWLQTLRAVLAFCSAPEKAGGAGAVDVLLRKSP
jgi:DNA-nicking Smr family endonuclease